MLLSNEIKTNILNLSTNTLSMNKHVTATGGSIMLCEPIYPSRELGIL